MTLDPLPWRAKIAPTLRYAYFSAEAAKECGSFIYLAHDGSEVEVTLAGEGLIDSGTYQWPDRKSVGPVVTFLRRGQRRQTARPSFILAWRELDTCLMAEKMASQLKCSNA